MRMIYSAHSAKILEILIKMQKEGRNDIPESEIARRVYEFFHHEVPDSKTLKSYIGFTHRIISNLEEAGIIETSYTTIKYPSGRKKVRLASLNRKVEKVKLQNILNNYESFLKSSIKIYESRISAYEKLKNNLRNIL